jgi:PAS domain S-box-containing protein
VRSLSTQGTPDAGAEQRRYAAEPSLAPDALDARFMRSVIECSDDAIVTKDLDGTITSWNPGAERLFGYSAEEVIGRSIRIIIPEDRQTEEDDVLRRIRSGERVAHFDTVRRRKDGSEVPISLTVSPVADDTGRVIGASKVARDISERREAERAVRESLALKDRFLSLVSHELRTPIAVIVGNGRLLLSRGERFSASERHQALADMTSEAERLQAIIENLLSLARVDADRPLNLEPVDLGRLVEEVIAAFARRCPEREAVYRGQPGVPPVLGEPTLLRLVLENLMGNACKYSPAGEPVELELNVGPRGNPEIHVLDRGIGIPAADRQRVFEPFFRSDGAEGRTGGLGLGLAVCRQAVEAHGGEIQALDRAGGGTEVVFWLPAVSHLADRAR